MGLFKESTKKEGGKNQKQQVEYFTKLKNDTLGL